MKDHRGRHSIRNGEQNRKKVKEWMIKNPDATMRQCEKDLGLCHVTVRKHIKAIKEDYDEILKRQGD
ncbi:MAG: hypothetical protein GY714_18265 [Desulfobacterales bacterium]|nr:hypothetical protein [Desulfobacterales bacterium]